MGVVFPSYEVWGKLGGRFFQWQKKDGSPILNTLKAAEEAARELRPQVHKVYVLKREVVREFDGPFPADYIPERMREAMEKEGNFGAPGQTIGLDEREKNPELPE